MSRSAAAEFILHGGHVWTGTSAAVPVEAVAVRAGIIVACGPEWSMRTFDGPATEHVSIGPGLLLPAFQDSHCHPLFGGLAELSCDLSEADTPEAWFALVAEYAAGHPDLEVISGQGWDPYPFEGGWPRREQLDSIVSDRPVVLISRDGHSTWANSSALERAGVSSTTPDPLHGRIERDAEGAPTGVFHEAAKELVERLVPAPDEERRARALLRGQAYLQRLGIGSWLDAIADPEHEATYLQVLRDGGLTGRATLALRWDPGRGLEQVEELVERCRHIEAEGDVRLTASAVKLFADGVIESSTATLLAPYHDASATDAAGLGAPIHEPEALRAIAVALHQAGFDLHIHAIGDGAVRIALDAIEDARQAGPARDARHTIAHLELVDDADIGRFATLEATASLQPLWAVHDQTDTILVRRLGAERLERRYPFGRLFAAGAPLAMGSDWDVSTADPLRILHVATQRTPPDGPQVRPLGPAAEHLALEAGLQAYTSGSARVTRLDATTGRIAVGRAADLVLLDRDPLTPGVALTDCRVRLTMVGGRVVYHA